MCFACHFRNIIVQHLRATCRISALYKCMNYYYYYLRETGFSSLLSIKAKSRYPLNPQADMWISISKEVPRFVKLETRNRNKSH